MRSVSALRLLLACAALFALVSAGGAATLPEAFRGVWVSADAPARDKCRRTAPAGVDDRPHEVMLTVEPGAVTSFEQHCTVTSVRSLWPPKPGDRVQRDVAVRLACTAEGRRWSAREIWHYDVLDGRTLLVVTALGQSNFRDARRRRETLPSISRTAIYHACQD